MYTNKVKKIAAVHDLSGMGRVSLTVVIPILSSMGFQVCPLPTAVLSSHTQYPEFSILDLTDEMPRIIAEWKKLDIQFDAFYTGYLGSPRQIQIVSDFIDDFRQPDGLVVVDPVLGDNGRLYTNFDESMIREMRHLAAKADVITPNLTELFYLMDKPYKAANTDAVPADALWKATGGVDYCIENTMAKDAQKFGAATRLVIRGTYTPDSDAIPEGTDWFFWNTTAYSITSLKEYYNGLKAAGNPTTIEQLFIAATDKFLAEVQKKNAEIVDIDALTAERLAVIENGGEISKIDNCLRWYQKGLNYYYYEIRHDNSDLGQMEFGKYGVVRNNWYDLNLKNVNGKGTPWYPGGGPEEPDPGEDIDQESAYLYFEIEVGPWVYWTTDFDI